MNEKDFTTAFGKWFKANIHTFTTTVAFEYKVTKTNTYNIKSWLKDQPHQLRALTHAQNGEGEYHKISDQSSGQKPFDAFYIVQARSLFVIYFNKQRRFFILTYEYLITKINQTSVSYKELEADLIAHELLKPKKKEILVF